MTDQDAFSFVEWSHSLDNKWIMGVNGRWSSITNEESISTEQPYQIFKQQQEDTK